MGNLASLVRNALLASLLFVLPGCGDPTPQDRLEWAVSDGSLESAKAALAAGAKADTPLPGKERALPLHRAAAHPVEKAVPLCTLLLEKGAKVDATDADGRTALFDAFEPDVVALLIEKGAKVDAVAEGGWTPLMAAASALNAGPVKKLLSAGADRTKRNASGRTAADEATVALRAKEQINGSTIVAERLRAQEILAALAAK